MSLSGKLITGYGLWNIATWPGIAQRTLTTNNVLFAISTAVLGQSCKWLFQKTDVRLKASIRTWIWKKIRTQMRKYVQTPVSSMPICYMAMLQPTNPQQSTSFEVWKGQWIVAPSLQSRLGPFRLFFFFFFFFFFKLSLKLHKIYLVGDVGEEVHLGLQFTNFLWVYPNLSINIVSLLHFCN